MVGRQTLHAKKAKLVVYHLPNLQIDWTNHRLLLGRRPCSIERSLELCFKVISSLYYYHRVRLVEMVRCRKPRRKWWNLIQDDNFCTTLGLFDCFPWPLLFTFQDEKCMDVVRFKCHSSIFYDVHWLYGQFLVLFQRWTCHHLPCWLSDLRLPRRWIIIRSLWLQRVGQGRVIFLRT